MPRRQQLRQKLTDYGWFQVHENRPGHVLPCSGFAEEGVERVVATPDCLIGGHLPIWLNPVLQTVEFPAGIADLHASLSNVNGYAFPLKKYTCVVEIKFITAVFNLLKCNKNAFDIVHFGSGVVIGFNI